ncbi:group II intron reverse transcriptase/maturase [Alphaproteobacteria bacterium]|nr:group II intron reverse transcriptase/maturase [Alphaproteobacteria bacterium]
MLKILKAIANDIGGKARRFGKVLNVSGQINKVTLLESCRELDGKKAVGVDGVTKEAYVKDLDANISKLSEKLRTDSYNPTPSRRVMIDKPGSSKKRPLGISCFEDKIVEKTVATLLSAIYETKFLDCSYGFRPGRNCHQAIQRVNELIMSKKVSYVVEADIRAFFDTLDHEILIKFLEHDIADKKHIRLIRKFLNAGIMEDGKYIEKEEGSPQGSVISPVLANVYLHYVLDLWFEKVVKKHCRGESYLVRYADDWVCMFQYEEDARKFYEVLPKRLGKFGLSVAEEKTRILEFGRFASASRKKRGLGKPETFDFLGFTFYCGQSYQTGRFKVGLKTSRKKTREKLKKLGEWVKERRNWKMSRIISGINRSLRGYYQYFGISGNSYSLNKLAQKVERIVFYYMCKRSQMRKLTWEKFGEILRKYLPLEKPRIYVEIRKCPTLFAEG